MAGTVGPQFFPPSSSVLNHLPPSLPPSPSPFSNDVVAYQLPQHWKAYYDNLALTEQILDKASELFPDLNLVAPGGTAGSVVDFDVLLNFSSTPSLGSPLL